MSSTLVEIDSQQIRKGFAMLCDYTETSQKLYQNWAETALRVDPQ